MPNHVTTRCVITGQSEALARFLETHIRPDSDADPRLDFNTIIPMPDCLKGTISGGFVDEGHFFAGTGQFNGDNDFAICEPDATIYERVYGHKMPTYEEEEEEIL
jgi:hypothetical protein